MIRHSIFVVRPDTHPGPAWQRDRDIETVLDTLDACRFPWWRSIPALTRNPVPPFPFPIDFKSAKDTSGWAGYVSRNHMWLTPNTTRQTVAHELAHVADLTTMGQAMGSPRPWFNQVTSPWRRQLIDMAVYHGGTPPSSIWFPNPFSGAAWEQRPIEAFTVPWTRMFFTDPSYHYPDWRFARSWRWDNHRAVRDVHMERNIVLFNDEQDISRAHLDNVRWAAEHGVVRGDDGGNFNPRQPVTREQLMTVLRQFADVDR